MPFVFLLLPASCGEPADESAAAAPADDAVSSLRPPDAETAEAACPFLPPPKGEALDAATARVAVFREGHRELAERRAALQASNEDRAALLARLAADPEDQDAVLALAVLARGRYFQSLEPLDAADAGLGGVEELREALRFAEAAQCDHARVLLVRELRWELPEGPWSSAADQLLRSGSELRSANTAELLIDLAEIAVQDRRWEEALRFAERAAPAAVLYSEQSDFHCRLQAVLFQATLDLGLLEAAGRALRAQELAAERSTEYVAANRAAVLVARANFHLAANEPGLVREDDDAWQAEVAAVRAVPAESRNAEQRTTLEVARTIEKELVWRRGLAEHELGRLDPRMRDVARATLEPLALDSSAEAASLALRAKLRLGFLALENEDLAAAADWIERARSAAEHSKDHSRSLWLAQRGLFGVLEGERDPQESLADLEESFALLLEEWDRAPRREGGVGFLHYGERRQMLGMLFSGLFEVLPEAEAARRALEHLLAAQSRGATFQSLAGTQCPTLDDVQRTLRDGEVVLVWMPAPERTWLFVLSSTELRCFEDLPCFNELDRARKEVWSALRGEEADFATPATALARALLPPLALRAVEGARWWTVCGLDLIGSLPFEALPILSERAIGLERPLRRLPSLPLGVVLAARGPVPAVDSVQVLLAPKPSARAKQFAALPDLEVSEAQREALQAVLPTGSELLEADHASLDRLLDPVTVRVIVAHGLYDDRSPRPAGIALSPSADSADGILWAAEPRLARSPAALVVLATCGAARGPLRRGDDGSGHLGGAFLAAGSRAVVLSTSDLRFQETLVLCTRFLAHLGEDGCVPSEALMLARRDVATLPGLAHARHHSLLWIEGEAHAAH